MSVIEKELDKKFYGVQFMNAGQAGLPLDQYLRVKEESVSRKYHFLITPPHLISCFFVYSREGILNLLNHEICCDFTHMIVTDGIDIDSNDMPLCGAV